MIGQCTIDRVTCPAARPTKPNTHPRVRVRLFNKGDAVAEEFKRAKLKREYKKLNDLSQLIYWSDVGREGAKHFEQLLQQKKMAQTLNATIAGEISVEKAQKMIVKAIEVQKKADAVRTAKLYKASGASTGSRSAPTRRRQSGRTERQTFRSPRSRNRGAFSGSSRQPGGRARGSGRSGASKRPHTGGRA